VRSTEPTRDSTSGQPTASPKALAEKYGIPIHAIGIGEAAEDLRPFAARAYAKSLVGLGG
jgi:signal recognition particle GTPase